MKFINKFATATVTGAMLLNTVAPAFAGSTISITNSTNGRDSENEAVVELWREIVVEQSNETQIYNEVDQEANTGENKVKDNLGGDIQIETGSVDQDAHVMTEAGMNMAEVDDCGCDYEVEIVNEKNGRDSENEGVFTAYDSKLLFQDNLTEVKTEVDQEAETGENEVKDNIDGDVKVETGAVDQETETSTTVGLNQAVLGGGSAGESSFELENSMNGRDSDNDAVAEIMRELAVVQSNQTEVKTEADQEGETGENEVKDNLGGVDIETGDVDQLAKIASVLGANALQADDCCDIEAELVNEKNGRDSENELVVTLGHLASLFQDNKEEAKNEADQEGETGENEVQDNNSDDLVTGSIDSSVEITNSAGQNVLGDADMVFEFDTADSLRLILLLIDVLL